jgi:hypothetical protein
MLETAFKNVNPGQGIGFGVFELLLAKKVLLILFAEPVAARVFVVPIVLKQLRVWRTSTDNLRGCWRCNVGVCANPTRWEW